MPDINKLYQSVNKEVHFAIISLDEDREKAKAFAKRKDFDFPIYFPKSRLPKVYESTAIPTTFVIDTEGHIVISQRGMAKYSSDAFITYLLGL
jgi:peroxiredoxin